MIAGSQSGGTRNGRAPRRRHAARSYANPSSDQVRSAAPASTRPPLCADRVGRLVAENADLVRRVQRLSPALVGMASDLAGARREGAALKREIRQLRSRLTTLEQRTAPSSRPWSAAGRSKDPFDGRRDVATDRLPALDAAADGSLARIVALRRLDQRSGQLAGTAPPPRLTI